MTDTAQALKNTLKPLLISRLHLLQQSAAQFLDGNYVTNLTDRTRLEALVDHLEVSSLTTHRSLTDAQDQLDDPTVLAALISTLQTSSHEMRMTPIRAMRG